MTPEVVETDRDEITFSFGENWRDYLEHADEGALARAAEDIDTWIGLAQLRGATAIDVGSGSGIHSTVLHEAGVSRLVSMDVDPHSVHATRIMRERAGEPASWEIVEGSVLDADFLASLGGPFEFVYSWGVLHHTGDLWAAMENTVELVAPGGALWIALYAKGPNYGRDLKLKQTYNRAGKLRKRIMIYGDIRRRMWKRLRRHQNPLAWNEKKSRRMNTYHDIIDWYGGLPYEVASPEEVEEFLVERGFKQEKVELHPETCNHIFMYRRVDGPPSTA